jgi:flagellum-specific peptidoglycan hydrolase FlgJ
MYNYNFGGIKGRSSEGHSCIREAHEGWGLRTQARLDRFRAYPNAQQGAADYLSLLTRLYPAAIEAAERGDVKEFVAALKSGGYFTGSEEAYAHSLWELFERALQWGFDASGTTSSSAVATIAVNDRLVWGIP